MLRNVAWAQQKHIHYIIKRIFNQFMKACQVTHANWGFPIAPWTSSIGVPSFLLSIMSMFTYVAPCTTLQKNIHEVRTQGPKNNTLDLKKLNLHFSQAHILHQESCQAARRKLWNRPGHHNLAAFITNKASDPKKMSRWLGMHQM